MAIHTGSIIITDTVPPKNNMRRFACLIVAALSLAACSPKERNAVPSASLPDIYPDYVGVTVPATIAVSAARLPSGSFDCFPHRGSTRIPIAAVNITAAHL